MGFEVFSLTFCKYSIKSSSVTPVTFDDNKTSFPTIIASEYGRANVKFCISSGAEQIHHLKEMDTWRIIATIFGVEYSKGKEAISTTCLDIYLRNVERLKPGYIGEGMFIESEEEE